MVNRDLRNEGNHEFPKEDGAIQRLRSERISADVALRLGKYFGMTPQFWMNLQADYRLCRLCPCKRARYAVRCTIFDTSAAQELVRMVGWSALSSYKVGGIGGGR